MVVFESDNIQHSIFKQRNIIARRVSCCKQEKKRTETKKQTKFLANQAKIQSNSYEEKSIQPKVRLYELVITCARSSIIN